MNLLTLRRFFWLDVPAAFRAKASFFSLVLRDGSYLLKWPDLAAIAPLIAFVLGVAIGWKRPAEWTTYSFSIALMSGFVLLAGISGALASWAWFGWIIGDFVFFRHPLPESTGLGIVWSLGRVRIPLLISYALLLGLIAAPVVARVLISSFQPRLREQGPELAKRSRPRGNWGWLTPAVWWVVAAVMTYAWTLVLPILIRPVVWWPLPHRGSGRRIGQTAPVDAFAPLQHRGWILPIVMLIALGIRSALIRLARERARPAAQTLYGPEGQEAIIRTLLANARTLSARGAQLSASPESGTWLGVLPRVLITTVLLSGLASTIVEGVVLLLCLLAATLVARWVSRVPTWTSVVARISPPTKFVLSAIASLLVTAVILGSRWSRMSTFLPMIFAVGLSVLATELLFADRNRGTS